MFFKCKNDCDTDKKIQAIKNNFHRMMELANARKDLEPKIEEQIGDLEEGFKACCLAIDELQKFKSFMEEAYHRSEIALKKMERLSKD